MSSRGLSGIYVVRLVQPRHLEEMAVAKPYFAPPSMMAYYRGMPAKFREKKKKKKRY